MKISLKALKSKIIDFENVNVSIIDNHRNNPQTLNYVKTETEGNVKYGIFEFNVYRGGKYLIKVTNKDGQELLNEYVEVPNVYIIGDTNFDGMINAIDTIYILRYAAKLDDAFNKYVAYAGNVTDHDDLNSRGWPDVDVSDAVLLSRYLAEDNRRQELRPRSSQSPHLP